MSQKIDCIGWIPLSSISKLQIQIKKEFKTDSTNKLHLSINFCCYKKNKNVCHCCYHMQSSDKLLTYFCLGNHWVLFPDTAKHYQ